MFAGERDLRRPDHGEQCGEREVAAWKPCDERGDEDEHFEPVGGEAHGPVRVERALAGAEDVRADQIDLDEDGEDDRQREREVQPGGAAPYAGEQAPRRRSATWRELDWSGHVPCSWDIRGGTRANV